MCIITIKPLYWLHRQYIMTKQEFNPAMLDYLICPVSGGALTYDEENNRLICQEARLAYPIEDGIPILLADKAIKL